VVMQQPCWYGESAMPCGDGKVAQMRKAAQTSEPSVTLTSSHIRQYPNYGPKNVPVYSLGHCSSIIGVQEYTESHSIERSVAVEKSTRKVPLAFPIRLVSLHLPAYPSQLRKQYVVVNTIGFLGRGKRSRRRWRGRK
jgi:hypothetical protein